MDTRTIELINLPYELLLLVAEHLPTDALLCLFTTAWHFNNFSNCHFMWSKRLNINHLFGTPPKERYLLGASYRPEEDICSYRKDEFYAVGEPINPLTRSYVSNLGSIGAALYPTGRSWLTIKSTFTKEEILKSINGSIFLFRTKKDALRFVLSSTSRTKDDAQKLISKFPLFVVRMTSVKILEDISTAFQNAAAEKDKIQISSEVVDLLIANVYTLIKKNNLWIPSVHFSLSFNEKPQPQLNTKTRCSIL